MAMRRVQLAIAALLLAAAPVAPAVAASNASAVTAFYTTHAEPKIWLRDATTIAGARRLSAVLRRGALDGFARGPELAAEVDTAILRAAAGTPADVAYAERRMSLAWLDYVAALGAPVPAMVYADAALLPKPPSAERLLSDAARAPALAAEVDAVAAVNPLYASLREAAWAGMAAAGTTTPDPRVTLNLARARLQPVAGRAIIVDAATQRLWLIADGRIADTMKVVVGKSDTPTPMLAGTIHYATFNPYWNIPSDVIRRKVAPLVVKRGAAYLKSARYEVASDWSEGAVALDPKSVDWKAVAAGSAEVRLRQLPGPANMMGKLKFGFVNDLGIYLHDTPHREFFAKQRRNYSLGCVRVEDAQRLGSWLLGREAVAASELPEQHVQLARGVPVYITYLTAQADSGAVAFVDDIYGRDPVAAPAALAAAESPAESPVDSPADRPADRPPASLTEPTNVAAADPPR